MGRGTYWLVAASAAGLIGGAAWAATGPLAALTGIERGRWQFKELSATVGRELCVADPSRLIQLHHPGAACTRFTIEDAPSRVAIQYNCGPRGYGKTTITVRQPGQIRLDTQGIAADGRPFDISYEGQFAGPCAPPPR